MLDHLDDTRTFVPDDDLRTAVRHEGTRRKRRTRLISTTTSIVLVIAIAGSALGIARWQSSKVGRLDIASVPQRNAAGEIVVPELTSFDKPLTFLVVGTDARPDTDGARTDTMLLVRVDVPAKRVRVLSLPRDLWVGIPDVGAAGNQPGALPVKRHDRLNTVHADGRATLLATVNAATGVTVDHYVELDWPGFQALVNGVGGLPLQFAASVRDDHTGFTADAGCRVLDGEAVLALSRSRYLEVRQPDGRWSMDPTSDYGRMARQRLLAEALVRRATKRAGGTDGLTELVRTVPEHAVLDDRLGLGDLVTLGQWSRDLPAEAIASAMPDVSEVTKSEGRQVLELKPGADARIRAFLDGEASTTSAPSPSASTPSGPPAGSTGTTDPVVTIPDPAASCS